MTIDTFSKVDLIYFSELLNDPHHMARILEITAESYGNAEVLLKQEFSKNDRAYVIYGDAGVIDAFFMVGWSRIKLAGTEIHCVFLGLSTVAHRLKGRGAGKSLYKHFFKDAKEHVAKTKESVSWWFHTATPVVASTFWKIAENISPQPDGAMREDHLQLLLGIEEKYGMTPFRDEDLPFILRGYAKARYSADEKSRIAVASLSSALSTWKVNETAGDRAVFVGLFS